MSMDGPLVRGVSIAILAVGLRDFDYETDFEAWVESFSATFILSSSPVSQTTVIETRPERSLRWPETPPDPA